MNWRQRLGAFIGGFDAGQHHRRLRGFRATRAHVNALIAAAGPDITARARWLVRNNGYAVNAVESWAANTVGDGIKPISKIGDAARKEELQRLWLAWTDEADAEGLTDFYGLQRRAAREVFIAGEVFFRIRMRRAGDGLTVPLQLQMLPAEMLPLEQAGAAANGNAIRQGIEFDRIGRRVAYHFLRRHPGDSTDPGLAGEVARVPASEVIHVIDPVEGGQLRGVSKLAPAIVKLFLLDQYDDAELDRKKVAAMYAMFVTSPAPENALAPAEDEGDPAGVEISPGQIVRLDPGEDVTLGQPADSGATYEPFQYRTLLQISAALGIPYAEPLEGKSYQIFDTEILGLAAKVQCSGTRTFTLDYRFAGRQRRMTIGRWPEWSATAVRERAKELRRMIDEGQDLLAAKEDLREAPRIKDMIDRYIREHLPKLAPANAGDQISMLKKMVEPAWGNRLVTDITKSDVAKFLDFVAEGRPRPCKQKPRNRARKLQGHKPTPVRANRVGEILRKMFMLAMEWEWRADNPAQGFHRRIEHARERFLSPEELTRLAAVLDKAEDQRAAAIIRMCMLTGARVGEVRTARFEQFNLDYAIWSKPASTTKQRKIHRVPISQEVVAIVRQR